MIFFTYIRPKESRSIKLQFCVFVENFAATVTLNVLCLPDNDNDNDNEREFIQFIVINKSRTR